MLKWNRALMLLAASWTVACAGATGPTTTPPPPPPLPAGTLRLLFVGNSLTSTWDIPTQVLQMAEFAGFPAPVRTTLAFGNYGLEDHWNGGLVRPALAGSTPYDLMIMQQGPSTLESSGLNLTEYVGKFSVEAKKHGTRPAVYAVWPPKGGDINAGIAHHEQAAAAAGAALFPAAEAWRLAWASDPTLPLYGPDDFHPSEHGSWLAALVIVAMIYDRPVSAFPNLFPNIITGEQEAVMRAAATAAISQFGKR